MVRARVVERPSYAPQRRHATPRRISDRRAAAMMMTSRTLAEHRGSIRGRPAQILIDGVSKTFGTTRRSTTSRSTFTRERCRAGRPRVAARRPCCGCWPALRTEQRPHLHRRGGDDAVPPHQRPVNMMVQSTRCPAHDGGRQRRLRPARLPAGPGDEEAAYQRRWTWCSWPLAQRKPHQLSGGQRQALRWRGR